MKFFTYLLLSVLVFAIFRTRNNVRQCATARERDFVIRTSATFWLIGFLFLLGFLFLPNKARLVMMLPGFFLVVTIARAYTNSRARLQQEQSKRVDMEKMKRANRADCAP
ncbi:MAG: hypothetical protein JWL90_4656 [Chthoniobacteraceae bacterium]|nr:hypothetical protein [Chthoniobacteraceae bacterium]MDB6171577.1 hypothetical protein [Chthoniobacteraceae bacterium]